MAKRLYLCAILGFLLVMVFPVTAQDEAATSTWDGDTRFTVLVMGMDRRPGEGDTFSVRTDAMLLVSVDPVTEQIGVLHIPRDIHFPLPGSSDFVRVNTLLLRGEDLQDGYGPYYAMDTLQYNLGLYIDRYVLVDFIAFETLVDAIGGLEITLTYTINDPGYPDMNYGYDPLYLPRGTHLLDGHDVLRFARTRHGDTDFVRGVRQLQVVEALRARLSDPDVLPDLVASAPTLLDTLRDHIFTDLALDEMIALATFALDVPANSIDTAVMNEAYLITQGLPDGTRAHTPDREKLVELLTGVFGPNYSQ